MYFTLIEIYLMESKNKRSDLQKSVNILLRERELHARHIEDVKNRINQTNVRLDNLEDIMRETLIKIEEQQVEYNSRFEKQNKAFREQQKAIQEQNKAIQEQQNVNKTLVESLISATNDLIALRRDYNKLHDTVVPEN